MAKNAVAKAEETKTEISTMEMPDFMKGSGGKGVENIGNDDIGLPRVSLLQALSPQVQTGEGKPGDYYHLLAEQNLGSSFRFIPIIVSKSFMLWKPRESGGGLLARADDGVNWTPPNAEFTVQLKGGKTVVWKTKKTVAESGLDKWGSSDPTDATSLPAATKMMNVLVYLPDFPDLGPTVLTLQRSSLKPGKKFLGKLKTSAVAAYGLVFEATSELVTGPKGTYNSPIFTGKGFNKDQEVYKELESLYEYFRTSGVRVNEAGLQEDGTEDGADNNNSPEGDRDF